MVFPKDTDAFQALRVGQVDAYGTTIKTAGYYFTQAPDLFEIAGDPFSRAVIGAAFRKDEPVWSTPFRKRWTPLGRTVATWQS